MKMRTFVMSAIASIGMASAAQAGPVSGQISLGGYAQAVGSSGMGSSIGINFANASGSSVSGSSGVLGSFGAGTGSFAALGACSSTTTGCGTIKDIANYTTSAPISQFLTLATSAGTVVSFDLTAISGVTRTSDATGGSVTFSASGFINYTGFDQTAGVFSLTSQGNSITSFSATTLATAVPEPMSLALLGGSLAAVGLLRRKKA